MSEIVPVVTEFEGHALTTLTYNDAPAWIAREVGTAIGYAQDGKRFATKITGAWAEELIEGQDYVVLAGSELEALLSLLGKGTDSVPFGSKRGLVLLLESGLHLALIKTRKPAGRRLRRFLATQVLPQLARTGQYLPEQTSGKTVPAAQLRVVREERLARQLDFQDRRFRTGTLQHMLRTLNDLGQLPDELRAAYEVSAAEIALNEDLSHLKPSTEPTWESPSQIAARNGVSPQKVGRLITKLGLRGKEGVSRQIINKARGHQRTVTSWLYAPEAVAEIEAELPPRKADGGDL